MYADICAPSSSFAVLSMFGDICYKVLSGLVIELLLDDFASHATDIWRTTTLVEIVVESYKRVICPFDVANIHGLCAARARMEYPSIQVNRF